jgi:N-acetylglucosamine kinase-like BadF-type ATPase
MFVIRHRQAPDVIGVDAGGTSIRLAWAESNGDIAIRTAASVPVRDLGNFLRKVWNTSGWVRRRPRALVVASRGVWTTRERRMLAREIARLADRVVVIADAQAALLGALGDRPGVLVLSGTGSIVVGRDGRGRWARAGGLGPLLGDEGSGFWLGRQWLRAMAEGGTPESALKFVRLAEPVARIAALAPSVLRRAQRGDRRARTIVTEAGRQLARQTIAVSRRLGLRRPVAVSWAGSVMDHPVLRRAVARALDQAGVRAVWCLPAEAPIVAAVRLATRLAASRSSAHVTTPPTRAAFHRRGPARRRPGRAAGAADTRRDR